MQAARELQQEPDVQMTFEGFEVVADPDCTLEGMKLMLPLGRVLHPFEEVEIRVRARVGPLTFMPTKDPMVQQLKRVYKLHPLEAEFVDDED